MLKRLPAMAVVACALLCAPRVAEACSCLGPIQPCSQYWTTAAVFEGTVTSVERGDRQLIATLDVTKSWKGVQESRVQVVTAADSGLCGFKFDSGSSYVVFAERGPGNQFTTSICMLTRRSDQAGDIRAYLDSLSRPSAGGTVSGWVRIAGSGAGGDAQLKLVGKKFHRTVKTRDGQFSFTNVPRGEYDLTIVPSRRFTISHAAVRHVSIPDPHACASETFVVTPAQGS